MNERNPLVQIFFLALMAGAVAALHFAVSPLVMDSLLSAPQHHRIGAWSIWAAYVLAILSVAAFIAASRKDPGVIWDAAAAARCTYRWPPDGVLYFADHECRTCLFAKPARSKHCSLCRRCIAEHDHHCVWINNVRLLLALNDWKVNNHLILAT
jgi:palmitoyltransferase